MKHEFKKVTVFNSKESESESVTYWLAWYIGRARRCSLFAKKVSARTGAAMTRQCTVAIYAISSARGLTGFALQCSVELV